METKKELEKQVDASYYDFMYYMDRERWVSYYEQIKLFHSLPSNACVLEIGAGLNINRKHIEEYLPNMTYKTLDIAEDLSPDYIGSAHKIPLPDNSFDAVCAFEILEHIPFDMFETALQEIKRVSKNKVIISLPHFGPPIKFLLKIPLLPKMQFAIKVPYYQKHKFNGQHYWEIGKRDYPIKKIKDIFKKHFELVEDFVPFENQYHHFFILNK
jgi:predicted SAM-dependent methyltransferase